MIVFGFPVRSCLIFLAALWLGFLLAGVFFYRFVQKKYPQPFPAGDIRNRFARIWRLVVYIMLLPAGVTCALAVWLVWLADEGIIPEF